MSSALEFGRVVLGWDDAEGNAFGEYRNSIQIELRRRGAGVGVVNLSMVEYVENCWSVQAVDHELAGDQTMPVMWNRETEDGSSQANVISISFDPPVGASGRIELEYEDYRESQRFTTDDVSMEDPMVFNLGPIDPYEAGHAVILFEDSQGRVTTAVGIPLLPQKGLAPSDGQP